MPSVKDIAIALAAAYAVVYLYNKNQLPGVTK